MGKIQTKLKQGDVVRHLGGDDKRLYLVEAVSESRAHLRPISGSTVTIGDATFEASGGGAINVSPNAEMEHIELSQLSETEQQRVRRTVMGDVAEMPGMSKKGKTGAAKAKREKAVPKDAQPCKCGCKEKTASFFFPGHDARFKGWMVKIERGQMEVKDLPKSVQSEYKFVKRGDGFVTTTNYKGEAHSGYDKGQKVAKAKAAKADAKKKTAA